MNALVAELRRLLSRRLLHILLGLVIIGFAIAGVVVFVNTTEPAAIPTRVLDEAPPGFDDGSYRLTEFIAYVDESSGLMIVLFLLIGATAMGAEWPQRSMTASLTFEPRRGVLLGSKAVSAVLVSFVGAIALLLVLSLFLLPTVFAKGTTEGADASWWIDYLQALLRIGFLAAFAALLGFSIATIGRNTAAALGLTFVYIAVLEPLIRSWKPHWTPWYLFDNITAVATGETQRSGFPPVDTRGPGGAVVVLSVYALGIYLGALALFRRRDIA